ncbi:TraB/GumN family protein [Vulcaniibacterium gelatinicum]|uniref:TraB/GumN family protein n=1 Tax=Vulcaniibacterium gelatinicum TaxID=2598725 RepID=UPI0011CCA37B|nr:TraB/GumN family protein [Vulcaniibacterium gelatinicum]
MRKLLLSAAVLAVLAVAHAAAPEPAKNAPPAASKAAAKADTAAPQASPVPLLWKVSDADNSLYLLGSFHLLKPDDYPLAAEVDAAFADAEALVFEVAPEELAAQAEVAAKFQQAAQYADGLSLSKVVPAQTLQKLEKMAAMSGASLATMENVEPWAVNLGLLIGVSQALGFRPEQGLDRHLMQRAAEAKKPAAGLETLDSQFAALDATPHAEQVADLDEFLSDPQKAIGKLLDMHAAWRAGDADKLDGTLRQEMARERPATYKRINVDRNRAWLPKLEARLKQPGTDDTLVVVGALHLLGSDGVVEMLRAKGYKVERICNACGADARR